MNLWATLFIDLMLTNLVCILFRFSEDFHTFTVLIYMLTLIIICILRHLRLLSIQIATCAWRGMVNGCDWRLIFTFEGEQSEQTFEVYNIVYARVQMGVYIQGCLYSWDAMCKEKSWLWQQIKHQHSSSYLRTSFRHAFCYFLLVHGLVAAQTFYISSCPTNSFLVHTKLPSILLLLNSWLLFWSDAPNV